MAEQLTDEEQLQLLKNWWKENGRSLMAIVIFALVAYFGWQWWSQSQQSHKEQASSLYTQLIEIVDPTTTTANNDAELTDEQRTTARYLVEQLQEGYNGTAYAVNATFYAAKLAVESNDLAVAQQQLQWAIDHADNEAQTLAKLRLSSVYLAQKNYDDALALVATPELSAFVGLFAVARGDILRAKGEADAARLAYQQALDTLPEQAAVQRNLVEVKLADLGAAGAD